MFSLCHLLHVSHFEVYCLFFISGPFNGWRGGPWTTHVTASDRAAAASCWSCPVFGRPQNGKLCVTLPTKVRHAHRGHWPYNSFERHLDRWATTSGIQYSVCGNPNGPFAAKSHMIQNNTLLADKPHTGWDIKNKVTSTSHASLFCMSQSVACHPARSHVVLCVC